MSLREDLNVALGIFFDERFEYHFESVKTWPQDPSVEEVWQTLLSSIRSLMNKRRKFFRKFDYEWARRKSSYNYPHEVYLQLAILNCISDIDDSHPQAGERGNIAVRILPNSSARPHVRLVAGMKVILFTRGYSSATRGFLRLWMRGCALGGCKGGFDPRAAIEYSKYFLNSARFKAESIEEDCKAYLGNLFQLLENEFPSMDHTSVFDDGVNERENWKPHFGSLIAASDTFILFHELAHILSSDYLAPRRTLENEVSTDRGAASLCIVASANKNIDAFNALAFGSVVYFSTEIVRLLLGEIRDLQVGECKYDAMNNAAILEMTERQYAFKGHLESHLGLLGNLHYDAHDRWSEAFDLPFNSLRWTILNSFGGDSSTSLESFLRSNGSENRNFHN